MAAASSPSNAEKHNSPITDPGPIITPASSSTPSSAPTLNPTTPASVFVVAAPPSPNTRLPLSSSSGSSSSEDADHEANSGSSSGVNRKKGGRGKVEMKKMEKESNLLVTFSKRKSGIFKKANEICILCGVQCAVIVFSPAGKVFSYGHPSVDHVVDRYLTGILNRPIPLDGTRQRAQNTINEAAKLTELTATFEEAKKDAQRLDKMREERVRGKGCKWGKPVEKMEGGELESFKQALEDLRSRIQIAEAARRLEMSFGSSYDSGLGGYQWFNQSYVNRDTAGSSSNPVFSDFFASRGNNNPETDQTGPGGHGIGGGGSPFSA